MAELESSAAVPQGVATDSVSFLPILSDPTGASEREWIYADVFRGSFDGIEGADYAIANERFKLLRVSGEEELYDLAEDPFERVNLLDEELSEQAQTALAWLRSTVSELRNSD